MRLTYKQTVETIHAPLELQERVMQTTKQDQRLKRREKTFLRTAICAACVIALALDRISLQPVEIPEQPDSERAVSADVSYTLGLTACALAANNGIAFVKPSQAIQTAVLKTDPPAGGAFTDYQFQIHGEGIQRVNLSIDKGGLYRCAEGKYELLKQDVDEAFDPSVSYGFWVPQEVLDNGMGLHVFDGAKLHVSAVALDGSVMATDYYLSADRMKQFQDEDGANVLAPVLDGDEATHFGVFGVPADSRFFQWPMRNSQTVSLSNPYGRINGSVHNGIDIPADWGTAILAAADGTVTEIGFTPEEGNYLTLDHGDGLTTTYAHCKTVEVQTGQTVATGEIIAQVGNTGVSTGAHLCFQVRQSGKAQNPVAYFDADVRSQLHAE